MRRHVGRQEGEAWTVDICQMPNVHNNIITIITKALFSKNVLEGGRSQKCNTKTYFMDDPYFNITYHPS